MEVDDNRMYIYDVPDPGADVKIPIELLDLITGILPTDSPNGQLGLPLVYGARAGSQPDMTSCAWMAQAGRE